MNDDQLDALLAQARARRADTSSSEYAFETRLMARLRAEKNVSSSSLSSSVWAKVSWRLIPFFAVCVIGLTVWQAEFSSDDTTDAALISNMDTSEAASTWSN